MNRDAPAVDALSPVTVRLYGQHALLAKQGGQQ